MNIETVFAIVIGLVLGAIITWLVRKLIIEKSTVTAAVFKQKENEQIELARQLAVLHNSHDTLLAEKDAWTLRYQEKDSQAARLLQELSRHEQMVTGLTSDKDILILEKQTLQSQQQQTIQALQQAEMELSRMDIKLQQQNNLYQQQKADLENMGDRMKKDFSLLANEILREKTQQFSETQQKELNTLMEPFKINLNAFKEQVAQTYKIENDDRVALRAQVEKMMEFNQQLSQDAKSLTQALMGNTKKQGDWGELILESILSYCGLQKNIHYFTQNTAENDEGARIRPDVLVKYPNDKAIIIDSKVSLVHYEQLCREENTVAQAAYLQQLLSSFRNHITGLSNKNYTHIHNSLDMVVMFVPVEAAYITALQNDPSLQQFAYSKNVLLISPSNLVLALKLIYDMWKRDAINKNAAAVADKAGKLYDKLVSFVENFEKIGRAAENLQTTYAIARKQLSSGKGNLIAQAEQMRQLEINATKKLPEQLTNPALDEEA